MKKLLLMLIILVVSLTATNAKTIITIKFKSDSIINVNRSSVVIFKISSTFNNSDFIRNSDISVIISYNDTPTKYAKRLHKKCVRANIKHIVMDCNSPKINQHLEYNKDNNLEIVTIESLPVELNDIQKFKKRRNTSHILEVVSYVACGVGIVAVLPEVMIGGGVFYIASRIFNFSATSVL